MLPWQSSLCRCALRLVGKALTTRTDVQAKLGETIFGAAAVASMVEARNLQFRIFSLLPLKVPR
jgi:hypothetical protein